MNRVTLAIDSLVLDTTDGLDPKALVSALERRMVQLVSSAEFQPGVLLAPHPSTPITLQDPSARAVGFALAESIVGRRR